MPSPRKVRRNRREEGGTDHRQKVTDGTNRSSVPPLSYKLPALTTAATATAGAIGLGTRFVDVQRAAIQFAAVHRGDCLLGFAIVSHFHKPKASGLSGVAIGTDVDTVYGAVGFKQG